MMLSCTCQCWTVIQGTYCTPSKNQTSPQRKLYFKVVNLTYKRKQMGLTQKTSLQLPDSIFNQNLPAGYLISSISHETCYCTQCVDQHTIWLCLVYTDRSRICCFQQHQFLNFIHWCTCQCLTPMFGSAYVENVNCMLTPRLYWLAACCT
jgi:hypothetical protein